MDWRRNASNGWEAYVYAKGRPINFQVTLDGRYSGIINNTDVRTRETRPELYISGKCHTPEEARDYIESLVDKLNNKPEVKKTEEIITSSERVEEELYVQKLAKTLEEHQEPVQQETEVTPQEITPEENPDPQDNLIDAKETDTTEDEKPAEPLISFVRDEDTLTIKTSVEGTVKYTTNGKDVLANSKIYREPFSVEGVEIVKAKLFDDDKNPIFEAEYKVTTN